MDNVEILTILKSDAQKSSIAQYFLESSLINYLYV